MKSTTLCSTCGSTKATHDKELLDHNFNNPRNVERPEATFKVWAEYDKDEKEFTGEIHFGARPIVAKAYNWKTWKKCSMTLTEIRRPAR